MSKKFHEDDHPRAPEGVSTGGQFISEKKASKMGVLKKMAAGAASKVANSKAGQAARKAATKERVTDLVVNTGGFLGSVAGGAVAGLPGKFAGDLIGAVATRKAIKDVEATWTAHEKLKQSEAYQAASRLKKLKMLRDGAISELRDKKKQEGIERDLHSDVAGWAIGNASAEGLGHAVEAISGVPFKGAAVAMATMPAVMKGRDKLVEAHRKRKGKS